MPHLIEPCLVLSTVHLTQEVADRLRTGELKILGMVVLEYGFYAEPYAVELWENLEAIPACLLHAVQLAKKLGMTRIFWDADADECELLTVYEWE
jgi:hypothetical protein